MIYDRDDPDRIRQAAEIARQLRMRNLENRRIDAGLREYGNGDTLHGMDALVLLLNQRMMFHPVDDEDGE